MPSTPPTVGRRIRDARIDQRITMKDLARVAGVSEATISRIERDIVEPRLPVARKIQQALNIDIIK